jgi:hypothetical protein
VTAQNCNSLENLLESGFGQLSVANENADSASIEKRLVNGGGWRRQCQSCHRLPHGLPSNDTPPETFRSASVKSHGSMLPRTSEHADRFGHLLL